MIGGKSGPHPYKQIEPQLSSRQGEIKQECGRRKGDKEEHILKKHRAPAAGQHQTDHTEHIVIGSH